MDFGKVIAIRDQGSTGHPVSPKDLKTLRQFDKNQDGKINGPELRAMATDKRLDVNGDGKASFSDVIDWDNPAKQMVFEDSNLATAVYVSIGAAGKDEKAIAANPEAISFDLTGKTRRKHHAEAPRAPYPPRP
jgi:Ca2+-binding EF-hand superfamily protein